MERLDLKNKKYVFTGSDIQLKEIIMFIDEIGFPEAAEAMAEVTVSMEQYEKLQYENSVETESLEESDFEDYKGNAKDQLILWLLNELVEHENI